MRYVRFALGFLAIGFIAEACGAAPITPYQITATYPGASVLEQFIAGGNVVSNQGLVAIGYQPAGSASYAATLNVNTGVITEVTPGPSGATYISGNGTVGGYSGTYSTTAATMNAFTGTSGSVTTIAMPIGASGVVVTGVNGSTVIANYGFVGGYGTGGIIQNGSFVQNVNSGAYPASFVAGVTGSGVMGGTVSNDSDYIPVIWQSYTGSYSPIMSGDGGIDAVTTDNLMLGDSVEGGGFVYDPGSGNLTYFGQPAGAPTDSFFPSSMTGGIVTGDVYYVLPSGFSASTTAYVEDDGQFASLNSLVTGFGGYFQEAWLVPGTNTIVADVSSSASGGVSEVAVLTAVPEPASMTLAVLATSLMLCRRGRPTM
jgi:hypothetical protein